jgi:deoxyguanosine kinase
MSAHALTGNTSDRQPPHRYLAIEGPIGVGKTSLAQCLAQWWSARLLLERATDNPFLERFYGDMAHYALPTQLHFMLQRAQQAREAAEALSNGTALVADFIPQKNDIFAGLTLPDDEWQLYRTLAAHVQAAAFPPAASSYSAAGLPSGSEAATFAAPRGLPSERGTSFGAPPNPPIPQGDFLRGGGLPFGRGTSFGAPMPDFVVYLQASPRTLLARIEKRARPSEGIVTETYLRRLSDAYDQFFHDYHGSPVLTVNTEQMNPLESSADFALVVERIETMRGGNASLVKAQ